MRRQLGDEAEAFLHALASPPAISVRYNSHKTGADVLNEKRKDLSSVPWCNSGFYLPERPVFTFDPAFHAGSYYVQEASSMFLEKAILGSIPLQPVMALDLCASPGGKTTHL